MYPTKGHNNWTKFNEITSCIFDQHMALDTKFISLRNFLIFFVFLKLNAPDIKHHVGKYHSNSF